MRIFQKVFLVLVINTPEKTFFRLQRGNKSQRVTRPFTLITQYDLTNPNLLSKIKQCDVCFSD